MLENNRIRILLYCLAVCLTLLTHACGIYFGVYPEFSAGETINLFLFFVILLPVLTAALEKARKPDIGFCQHYTYYTSYRFPRGILFITSFAPLAHLFGIAFDQKWGILFPLFPTNSLIVNQIRFVLFGLTGFFAFAYFWLYLLPQQGVAFFNPRITNSFETISQSDDSHSSTQTINKERLAELGLGEFGDISSLPWEEQRRLVMQEYVIDYMANNPEKSASIFKAWLNS